LAAALVLTGVVTHPPAASLLAALLACLALLLAGLLTHLLLILLANARLSLTLLAGALLAALPVVVRHFQFS
jgi:hypothetical protein